MWLAPGLTRDLQIEICSFRISRDWSARSHRVPSAPPQHASQPLFPPPRLRLELRGTAILALSASPARVVREFTSVPGTWLKLTTLTSSIGSAWSEAAACETTPPSAWNYQGVGAHGRVVATRHAHRVEALAEVAAVPRGQGPVPRALQERHATSCAVASPSWSDPETTRKVLKNQNRTPATPTFTGGPIANAAEPARTAMLPAERLVAMTRGYATAAAVIAAADAM